MSSLLKRIFSLLPISARTAVKDAWLNMPIATTRHINRVYWRLHEQAEIDRSRIDVPAELVLQFVADQNTPEFLDVYNISEPLVSICIATYNRAKIVTERTLKSLINQTYKNIEVIIVGDCCTDNTQELIEALNDPRIHFLNLAERGAYPPESKLRWMVAGTVPMNKALELAKGEYICHCDDDDEFDPTKVEKLVGFMREKKPHFIWHDFYQEQNHGKWELRRCYALESGYALTSSIFYHRWFKRVLWDIEAWRFKEAGDYNRIRRLKYLGMNAMRFPEPLIHKYLGTTAHADKF